jgi:hypothetical protein
MEDFTWLLVSRMFIPLIEPVQPHNWEVFEWSPEFWARMGAHPKSNTGKATHQAKPALPVPAAQPVNHNGHTSHAKSLTATEKAGQDEDAIGVFEL